MLPVVRRTLLSVFASAALLSHPGTAHAGDPFYVSASGFTRDGRIQSDEAIMAPCDRRQAAIAANDAIGLEYVIHVQTSVLPRLQFRWFRDDLPLGEPADVEYGLLESVWGAFSRAVGRTTTFSTSLPFPSENPAPGLWAIELWNHEGDTICRAFLRVGKPGGNEDRSKRLDPNKRDCDMSAVGGPDEEGSVMTFPANMLVGVSASASGGAAFEGEIRLSGGALFDEGTNKAAWSMSTQTGTSAAARTQTFSAMLPANGTTYGLSFSGINLKNVSAAPGGAIMDQPLGGGTKGLGTYTRQYMNPGGSKGAIGSIKVTWVCN